MSEFLNTNDDEAINTEVGNIVNAEAENVAPNDTKLLGAKVLAGVNFEDSHQKIVQSSFERARERGEKIEGERPGVRRNYAYLDRIEKLVEKYGSKAERRLCRFSATNLIVKPETISDKYWERENRRSIERGDGELTDETKDKKIEEIQEIQRRSVEKWSNYLGDESSPFPLWFKTYTFDGISKMGRYDGDSGTFLKRRKGDIASYPNLNEAALSKTYQAIVAENGNEPDVQQLVNNGNFNKLYSKFYTEQNLKLESIELPEKPEDVRGKWVEYGVDQMGELFAASSLNGCWCIGQDYGTLEGYFSFGYYDPHSGGSLDTQEKLATDINNKSKFILFHPTDPETESALGVPVVSIRLDRNGEVAEISGIVDEKDGNGTQILNDVLVPEVERKVMSLPGGEKFKKAFEQREELIGIHQKLAAGEQITGDDLAFLWGPDNIYYSIGEYEDLEDSASLAEAKEKTIKLFTSGEDKPANEIGARKLSYILSDYGLVKSTELVPQIAASGIDLAVIAQHALPYAWDAPEELEYEDREGQKTRWARPNKPQIKFGNALLENGLSIKDLYSAFDHDPNRNYDQNRYESELLRMGFSSESILESLKKNGRRGSLSIKDYAKDGLTLEEIVPFIDLTDRNRWYFEIPQEDWPDEADFWKLLDQSAIAQFQEKHDERWKYTHFEPGVDKAFDLFLEHLRKEKGTYGYLGHIDNAIKMTRSAWEANNLLECGADPDRVLNKELDWAEKYNDDLDDYVRFGALMDAYKRRGEGPVAPDYIVENFSPEFVAQHADELMSDVFGASADAVAKRLDSITVLDRINDLNNRGANLETLAGRTGEAFAHTLGMIRNFANNLDTPTQIPIDGFKKVLAEWGVDAEDKDELKNILKAIIDSIE